MTHQHNTLTIHPDPLDADVRATSRTTRSPRLGRWALPAGLVAIAATAIVGTTQFQNTSNIDAVSATRPPSEIGVLDAQVLVQKSIDEALAAASHHTATGVTRAQVLIQESIDRALAARADTAGPSD